MNIEQENNNPLMGFTRQITTYVKFPSQGVFDSDEIYTSVNNEIGIKPMTASDEISLTTPEALLNGEAIVNVIKSCIPDIINPRKLTVPDIDAALVGIRLASYGENMEVTSKCPKCDHESQYDAPLSYCIDNITMLEKEYKIQLSEKTSNVFVTLRPYTFEQNIKEALFKFNEAKALSLLARDNFDSDEEIKVEYNKIIANITNNSIDVVAGSIIDVFTSDGNVISGDPDQTREWIKELPIGDATTIINKVTDINRTGIAKELSLSCEECEHTWETELNFDPSNFFGNGS